MKTAGNTVAVTDPGRAEVLPQGVTGAFMSAWI